MTSKLIPKIGNIKFGNISLLSINNTKKKTIITIATRELTPFINFNTKEGTMVDDTKDMNPGFTFGPS